MEEENQMQPGIYEVTEDGNVQQKSPNPEEKHNVHKFISDVAKSQDTTKTGNLSEVELGITSYSERSFKKMQLDCIKLAADDDWADYMGKSAEVLSSTSLSKYGFLDKLAIVQRRELADMSEQPKKENSGWFKKKDKDINAVGGGQ